MTNTASWMQPISSPIFRDLMGHYPATVTIIATGKLGTRSGMTATAVCSMTADPPQILVCLNKDSGTCRALIDYQAFSVNILNATHVAVARKFAGMADSAKGEERFSSGYWEQTCSLAVPVLRDSVAALECVLVDHKPIETHMILVGKVVSGAVDTERNALIYNNRSFGLWSALDGNLERKETFRMMSAG